MIDMDEFRIRTLGSDGKLLQAGMTWYEPRLFKLWLLGIPAAISFIVAFFAVPAALLIFIAHGTLGTPAHIAAASAGLFTVMFLRWFRGKAAIRRTCWRCILIFGADDTVLYAKGKASREPVYEPVPLRPGMIASIEIKSYYAPAYLWHPNLCVDFNLLDGQTITVARHLPHELDAKIVSTQLNLALQEIRAAMATPRAGNNRTRNAAALPRDASRTGGLAWR